MKPIIAITLGDVAGIGPEVVAKALTFQKVWKCCEPWIYGPPQVLENISKILGLPLHESIWGRSERKKILVRPVGHVESSEISCGKIIPKLSRIAIDSVSSAVKDILSGKAHALVTAPLQKKGVVKAGVPFIGHTEFLAELTSSREVVMMMASPKLKVALVTTHVPLKEVSSQITVGSVLKTIKFFNEGLKRFGIKKPKMAVASLNPHGGEDEGVEEKKILRPAILKALHLGLIVEGPKSADALFRQAYLGQYDGIVVMYHDQGLTPLKMLYFDESVNITLGLPFIRTSPDHGTAYDIAGRGIARPESMVEAICMAARLTKY